MAANRLRLSQQLISRLKKVINEWPVDSSRKGRDLGEYLKESYMVEFQRRLDEDIDKAVKAVESLERLNSNYYHHKFTRDNQFGFTGDVTINNPWLLSNKTLNELDDSSAPIWQRLLGKKK